MISSFRVLAALGAGLVLSACGPRNIDYAYRGNTTVAQHDRDSLRCEVEATQRIPPNIQTRRTPVFYTPIQTTCQEVGTQTQCTTSGGEMRGGEIYTVDVNEDLRAEVETQCMRDLGYQFVTVPTCPTRAVTPETRARLSGPLVAPMADVCAVQITERGSNLAQLASPAPATR